MPKTQTGGNAVEAIKGRIRQGFGGERELFSKTLEKTVKEGLYSDVPPPPVQKPWGRRISDDGPHPGHRPAAGPCCFRKRLATTLRDRTQNLVIVATGNDSLDADGAAREQCCSGRG